MKALLIGGTPGTGKTQIAAIVADRLNLELISISELAEKYSCIEDHDSDRDTDVINEDCIVDALIDVLDGMKNDVLIEGHYIDLVPSEYVATVFILRTHPSTLKQRLAERGYSNEKIQENVEAEIIGVCQLDSLDVFGETTVKELDTSNLTIEETVDEIIKKKDSKDGLSTRIDWMKMLEKEGRLDDFLSD
jgi:adenylate kinase